MAAAASDCDYLYTFLCIVVCRLSVVCHIRVLPCLNRSKDFDAIWQVHLWGPVTHCVSWESLTPQEKGRFAVKPCSQNMPLHIAAATWRITTKSDSTFNGFNQITLVVVLMLMLS